MKTYETVHDTALAVETYISELDDTIFDYEERIVRLQATRNQAVNKLLALKQQLREMKKDMRKNSAFERAAKKLVNDC